MKISQVTRQDLKEFAREYNDDIETNKTFDFILPAVKSYIKGYTGLSDEQLDTKEDLTIALLVISGEMYDNRAFTVQEDKINPFVKSTLDMHSINLL